MSMGFFDLTSSLSTYTNSTNIYRSVQTSFRDSILSTDSLSIQSGLTKFLKPTIFNSPAVIKHLLRIQNADAGTNKVATSYDNTGWVKFKTVQELKGTVPFGTIVSILPSIFADNSKFINSHSFNLLDGESLLPIYAGKGVGIYDGWYLCNGKNWTNGDVTHLVPALGQFNYKIDDNENSNNPLGQGDVPLTTNNKTHITGGSDINMAATPSLILVYNVTSTVDTSSVTVGAGTGTTFKIKQLPQIIYLEKNDLYWSEPGTGQAPAVPLTFLLDDGTENLIPNPYTITSITDKSEGNSYSFTSMVTAPSGYHWSAVPSIEDITGLPGYATITDITLGSGTYPTELNISFSISSHPAAPEPPATGIIVTLGITTASFISPTFTEISLSRFNTINTTTTTPTDTTISYNFTTGYTFTLVLSANSGYLFSSNTAYIQSVAGGATYTVNSNVLNAGNTQLTLNITITGVSIGVTELEYAIGVGVYSTIPRISYNSTGLYPILATPNQVASTVITLDNNTESTVYVYVGITQYTTGTNTGFAAYYVSPTSPTFSLSVIAGTGSTTYYGNSYTLTTGTTMTGTFYRASTTDTSHMVRLYYSFTSTGTKYAFNYEL